MSAKIHTYPAPQGFIAHSQFSLTAGGQSVFLHQGSVYYPPYLQLSTVPYGIFSFEGSVELRLKTSLPLESVVVRPLSRNLCPRIEGDTVVLMLDRPENLSVEINGNVDHAVLIFANPLEKSAPSPSDPAVRYFGPGVHEAGIIELKTGQTLYLAGGAYVHGMVKTDGADHIRICGRGILDAQKFERGSGRCVQIDGGRDIRLEGIVVHDSPNWTVRIQGCDEVVIDNLKIIGWRGNSDGIDICGSRDVVVENCFIRNWDDGLAIKAFGTGDVHNVRFRHCVLWNDFARPIEVGYENQADEISDIVFEEIDVIHSLSGYPIMGIHQGDRAIIHDIKFQNIRVEDAPNAQLFDLRIKPSAWNKDPKPGRIHSILFQDIEVVGRPGLDRLPEPSRLEGFTAENDIRDVRFENIVVLGQALASVEDLCLTTNTFVHGVSFHAGKSLPAAASLDSRLTVGAFTWQAGRHHGELSISLTNLSAREAAGWVELDLSPESDAVFPQGKRLNYRLAPGKSATAAFPVVLLPGKYFVTTQAQQPGLRPSWQMLELPWPVDLFASEVEARAALASIAARPLEAFAGGKAGWFKLAATPQALLVQSQITEAEVKGAPAKVSVNAESSDQQAFVQGAFAGKKFMVENEPAVGSALQIFAARPVAAVAGEAAFILPETAVGRTTALIHGTDGLLLAPELRNILEITYVFKNQPQAVITTQSLTFDSPGAEKVDGGWAVTTSLSWQSLGLPPPSSPSTIWLEFMASTVLPGQQVRRAITAFHSLRPEDCAQMFGRIVLQTQKGTQK